MMFRRHRRRVQDDLTREEVNARLRAHAGEDTDKLIAWFRSAVLQDDEAELLLARLDREQLARDRAERMRFAVSGVIEDDDDETNE